MSNAINADRFEALDRHVAIPAHKPGVPERVALLAAAEIDQIRGDVRAAGLYELDRALEKAFAIAERQSKNDGI